MIQSTLVYKKEIRKDNLILFLFNSSVLSTVAIQFFITSSLYSTLRPVLYLLVLATLLLVFTKKSNTEKNSIIFFYTVTIYLSLISALLICFYKSEVVVPGSLIEFTLPFLILYIGFKVNLTKDQMSKLILRYMILVTFLGLYIVFYFGDGFHVTQQYFFNQKNTIGPFLGSVVIISLISLLAKNRMVLVSNKILIILFLVNISSLFALRNRAGIVAVGICLIIYALSKTVFKTKFKITTILLVPFVFLILAALFITGALNPVIDIVNSSLFLNFDLKDLNNLSANRTDTYLSVLEFLKVSPLFGEVLVESNISTTPHNYLLNLWLHYGVVGMLPISIFYFSLWVLVLFKLLIRKRTDLGFYLLLFALVVSIFEPDFPFSPLTTVTLTWFLFGYSIKKREDTVAD